MVSACVVEKGQYAPAFEGLTSEITAKNTPQRVAQQKIAPKIDRSEYVFLPLIFDEEAEESLEGKIGKSGELQSAEEVQKQLI